MLAADRVEGYERDMTPQPITIPLPTEDDTAALAQKLAQMARVGDALCLEGTLGMGKSLLARHFIRSLTSQTEPVPSPTFALLQTYQGRTGPLSHFDLYRLEHEDELLEIGFYEALEGSICLIEWPDKAGRDRPQNGLTVRLEEEGAGRRATLVLGSNWQDRRDALIELVGPTP